MKYVFRVISLVILTFSMLFSSVACNEKVEYTENEVIEAAKSLIEASYEINEIYFGKGLPISEKDSEAAKEFAADLDLDVESVDFLPVTDESPYKSIEKIKEATAKVYSADYCEIIYETAFAGRSLDDGSAAVYARYMENSEGILTARIDIEETCAILNRTYDLSTLKVKKMKPESATVTVQSLVDGEKDNVLTFTLIIEEDGWRLDTPTY
ncbi:MAG: hypothetical protein E7575_01360 [Ruminococcaceae bacterium]|nr:hypothetical protein [Oscillospiraceae bacterium]